MMSTLVIVLRIVSLSAFVGPMLLAQTISAAVTPKNRLLIGASDDVQAGS